MAQLVEFTQMYGGGRKILFNTERVHNINVNMDNEVCVDGNPIEENYEEVLLRFSKAGLGSFRAPKS